MSWFGSSQTRLRQPGQPLQFNGTPSPGPGDTVGQTPPPPPTTAAAGSIATFEAMQAAKRQRKRAAAKPVSAQAVGQNGAHPNPAGAFVGRSLLGY